MESIHYLESRENLNGVECLSNWKNGKDRTPSSEEEDSRFLDENWTTSLVRRIKERLGWEDVEGSEHLYEDLDEEEMLHPDVKIYFAYLEKYC